MVGYWIPGYLKNLDEDNPHGENIEITTHYTWAGGTGSEQVPHQ
jgi:hypothetical protein